MAVDALAAGKDVYLEKPVTHTLEEGAILTHAVRSSKQILQCGMQQRSWPHFRDAVNMIQGGSLGRVVQARTYWWQNYQRNWAASPKPIDTQALDWKLWLGGAPDQLFTEEKYNHWRWFWNFGGGAMTDLLHPLDRRGSLGHEIRPTPRTPLCSPTNTSSTNGIAPTPSRPPSVIPGFDVVYEGMMNSSIDDGGGLNFRGTEATLRLNRRWLRPSTAKACPTKRKTR
jgi:predicted dehydrogenase